MEFYREKVLSEVAEEETAMLEDPQRQPEKLVLPAVPTEPYHAPLPEYLAHAEQRPFQPGGLIRKNLPSASRSSRPPHKRLLHLWKKDPAYKVLFIAIGVVLASSIVSVALLAGFIHQLVPSPASVASLPLHPQATPTLAHSAPSPSPQPTATPTPEPTPMPTPTPAVVVTPAPVVTAPAIIAPTPNPDGKLTVQIDALPEQINNNVRVPVKVITNQPGAIVSLFVTYNAIPILYNSDPQTTDANGTTIFSWNVHERTFSPFTKMVTANITATVHYQGRPRATSQTVTVYILTK
jgi:hypothetical protein